MRFSVFLVVTLLVSGCGSNQSSSPLDGSKQSSSPSDEIVLLQGAVKKALPLCDLQPINIPREGKEVVEWIRVPGEKYPQPKKESNNGKIIGDLLAQFSKSTDTGDDVPDSTDGLFTVNSFKEFGDDEMETLSGHAWNFGQMGQVYACNSKGVSVEEYGDWYYKMFDAFESVYGRVDLDNSKRKCRFYDKPPLTDKVKAEINACIEQVESFYDLGFWVVALDTGEFDGESVAKAFIKREMPWVWSPPAPVGILQNTVFRFRLNLLGHPDGMELNRVWDLILDNAQARDWTSLDLSDIPKVNTSPDTIVPATLESWRQEWDDLLNPPAEVCGERLKVDELTAEVGDCGKLKVEVFQSDLNTGKCSFLAEWTTSKGSTKSGIFDYCTSYQEGLFEEGYSYDVKVRVQGPTTYTTESGSQNTVLRFEVIK